jgi:hypothetical protein
VNGAVTIRRLFEEGRSHLSLACSRCERRGRYSLLKLLHERGDVGLPDLLHDLSRDCPRHGNTGAFDRCGARYEGL